MSPPPSRLRAFWIRHRTLFWSLHSIWALLTGVAVMFLARERYGFVPWVGLALVLTWTSTLLFGRKVSSDDSAETEAGAPRASDEVASYVTRTLYQETLFFLLPFYAYSTVLASPNVVFVALLASLALLSCLDLVFDRLLRTHPVFALLFFATVAFAALNLVLPLVWSVRPAIAATVAGVVAVSSAFPLALSVESTRRMKLLAGGAGVAMLTTVLLVPMLIPPVPLRLDDAVFSAGFERASLTPLDRLDSGAAVPANGGVLYVLLEVFAPGAVPTAISLEWRRDGEIVRTSRDIEITAHDAGFRVWDAWRSESGAVPPGTYQLTIRTADQRIFGRTRLTLEP